VVTNEKTWSAGLKAWNERCEAQGLGRGCDTETRDAKLEAILHSLGQGQLRYISNKFSCSKFCLSIRLKIINIYRRRR